MIVYFLLLSTLDLHLYPVFSFVNLIICGIVIFLAILELRKLQKESFRDQFGFGVGLMTGFTATVIFTIFSLLYGTEVRREFSQRFSAESEFGWFANVRMPVFTTFSLDWPPLRCLRREECNFLWIVGMLRKAAGTLCQ